MRPTNHGEGLAGNGHSGHAGLYGNNAGGHASSLRAIQLSRDRTTHHQWHRAGGRDADGGHVFHRRHTDGVDDAVFSYQWVINDGTADTDITDATDSTYVIKPWDLGKHIKVQVSFTDDGANEETLTSSQTTAVVALPTTSDLERPTNLMARTTS